MISKCFEHCNNKKTTTTKPIKKMSKEFIYSKQKTQPLSFFVLLKSIIYCYCCSLLFSFFFTILLFSLYNFECYKANGLDNFFDPFIDFNTIKTKQILLFLFIIKIKC